MNRFYCCTVGLAGQQWGLLMQQVRGLWVSLSQNPGSASSASTCYQQVGKRSRI